MKTPLYFVTVFGVYLVLIILVTIVFFFLIGCEGDIALLRETRCIRLITVEEETKIFNTEKTIV